MDQNQTAQPAGAGKEDLRDLDPDGHTFAATGI